MPIDSNFIAVTLMILGYSLNDTIVIYDRVRENRNYMAGNKIDFAQLFNKSGTQVFRRTVCTSVTTLSAIVSVLIFAMVFNIQSVVTFALPMMIGVISGCYSSICIAGPLWVMWQNHKEAKK
jgi:preprotein translocase SecF subunit